MKRACLAVAVCAAAAGAARGELVGQTWGGDGKHLTHPGTMKVLVAGQVPRLLFDLSAIPAAAKVHHASLFCFTQGGQPREPVKIHVVGKLDADGSPADLGEPLKLEAPWYGSFDATGAVQGWVKSPAGNLGLAVGQFDGFDSRRSFLEVRYEAKAERLPPQVEGLRAIHRAGQTVLVFKELELFRPPADQIVYVRKWRGAATEVAAEPGADEMGNPAQPAIRLKTLRDLQGLKVRTQPGRGQEEPPFERIRELPEVAYRVYRSAAPITPATIQDAERVGSAAPLSAYDHKMNIIHFSGEYYQKHERPETVIPTFCVDDLKAVMPGEAFYVHTPAGGGKAYYAVTAAMNGTENLSQVTAANSLAEPVVETPAAPAPVKYFTAPSTVRARHDKTVEHWFLFWLAPPFANLPDNTPRRVVAAVPEAFKPPGPMLIDMSGSVGREGQQADTPAAVSLRIEVAGVLAYNQGRGTLRSFRECQLDYYPERHLFHIVNWARGAWRIDPACISGTKGMSIHVAIRHPEVFRVFWPDRPEFYQNDFDSKWNPHGWSLGRELGPPDLVKTPDGSCAWDIYNVGWTMARDPGKDVPFMGCLFSQPKDGNHGAEYGWQDDPKGWAALRDCRQPYVAQWGGGGIAGEVRNGLYGLRWDKSVPAFSNCSLDNSPGNGDCDDGDPWGQINGYLFWDYDSVVDEKDRWEMTVHLVGSSPEPACTVDLTPRHCRAFKPQAGATFRWTNTPLGAAEPAESGTIAADKWGLVTLRQIAVAKGKNRIVIRKP